MVKKSKGELLDILYGHLHNQQEIAQEQWGDSKKIAEFNKKSEKKKDNAPLREYNRQVEAIGKTIDRINKIQNTTDAKKEQEEDTDEELVD